MIDINNKEKCCGCQACLNICPKSCISMNRNNDGFIYPSINYDLCIKCGACERVCPFSKKEPEKKNNKPLTYAAKSVNRDIRDNSSSGGIFSLLALDALKNGGVVYGVAMSDDFTSAKHIRIDNERDISKIRGSKYLQAENKNIFLGVKADLESGKAVLFSGVGCQINALKLFLQKDYENLLTIDVMCHGVPSPLLWQKYVDYLEKKYKADIHNVSFRKKKYTLDKKRTPNNSGYVFEYHDVSSDPFMTLFLRNYCLRESCYECNIKKLEPMSDITLGDFWGVKDVCPDLDDNMGTSLVLVHSFKGEEALKAIGQSVQIQKADFDSAIKYNPSYFKSVDRPVQRNDFFDDLNSLSFKALKKKYCRTTLAYKFKKTIKHSFLWKITKSLLKRGNKESSFSYGVFVVLKRKN